MGDEAEGPSPSALPIPWLVLMGRVLGGNDTVVVVGVVGDARVVHGAVVVVLHSVHAEGSALRCTDEGSALHCTDA